MVPLLMQNDVLADADRPAPDGGSMAAGLERVLRWPGLQASERQKRLLVYLVEETLAGRGSRLKAYNIATTILGRNERFDPQIDPVVRIEVSHLRRCLERYYLIEGQSEQHRIVIPKGSYAPRFQPAVAAETAQDAQERGRIEPPRARWRGAYFAAATGAALLALSLLLALFRPNTPDGLADAPSIRVDGFVNASGDPVLDPFAQTVTSEITSALASFKSLDVYLPDGGMTSTQSAVEYRLRGSVSRLSNNIRVTVQLVNPKTGTTLWERDYSTSGAQPAGGIEIARHVAEAVGNPYGALFSQAVTAAGGAQNASTVRACMLDFYAYVETWERGLHRQLRDCHEMVVRLAPNYSEAWAHLAFLYLDEFKYGYNPRPGAAPPLERTADAARRAIAADPTNAWAHVGLALVDWFNHDLAGFSVEAERALALNPNDPLVAGEIGTRLFLRRDYDRGLTLIQRALTQGAGRPKRYRDITTLSAYLHRDYASALDEAIKGEIERRPLARLIVAAVYGKLGRRQDAERVWEALRRDMPDSVSSPRAFLLNREWAPEIADALMDGLEEAGVFKDSRQSGQHAQYSDVAVPLTSSRVR